MVINDKNHLLFSQLLLHITERINFKWNSKTKKNEQNDKEN